MSERRADIACALLLVAIVVVLFADVLFLGSNFFARDLYAYHFPMKQIVRETIARGEFPSWNRYFFGGQPLAANPAYEVFYPMQWLIFVGDYPFGFALHILAHLVLALLGMYALLRAIPLRPLAAMFGALSFGLSGFLPGSMTNLPAFFVWSWAPLLGWALLRLTREPNARRFAVAALIGAMPLLVAEPVAIAGTWLLLIVAFRKRLLLIASSGLASVAIAAIQLLPMIDFVRDTPRAHGFPFDVVSDWSMPPVRIVELFAPVHIASYQRGFPYLPSVYAGIVVGVLVLVGFALRARGAPITAIVLAISFVLAIGDHTPLLRILYTLGMRSIRYPEKFMVIGIVAMIVFAATIFDRIPRRELALVVLLVALADGAFQANRLAPRMPHELFTAPPVAQAIERDAVVFPRARWTSTQLAGQYMSAAGPWFQRNALYPLTPAAWSIRIDLMADIDETALNVTHQMLDAMRAYAERDPQHWSEPFMQMAGVRYVVDYRPFEEAVREAASPMVLDPIRVLRVAGPDRYRLCEERGRLVRSDRASRSIANQSPAGTAGDCGRDARAPMRVQETSNGATIDVDASAAAQLVITVTRHKYWRATIDGKPAALQAANIAYQSLAVPAGRHRIEMRYRNPLLLWGAIVSAIALVAVTAPTLRRRRPRSGS